MPSNGCSFKDDSFKLWCNAPLLIFLECTNLSIHCRNHDELFFRSIHSRSNQYLLWRRLRQSGNTRIDDPATRTFERCSGDTFEIYGPCTYQICYLYLYRSGYDGWKPERVDVYGYNTRPVSFYYNVWIPANIWYGFNYCYPYQARSATK